MDPLIAAYLTFTLILAVTPGSTTAVVVRNTLHGGRRAGFAAAMGAALANTVHATAAGLGLAVVFSRWPSVLTALHLSGGCYLAWLGIISVYRFITRRDGGLRLLSADQRERDSPSQKSSFRQGVAINLLNPAIATFYLVVVPSFLPTTAPRWYFALLAAIHIVLAFTCHGAWTLALDQLRSALAPPLARRVLEGATGIALLALAARILLNS